MKIVSNIPFSDIVDCVTRQFLTSTRCFTSWTWYQLGYMCLFSCWPWNKYVQAPLWTGREELTTTESRRKDCSVAANIWHCSRYIKLQLHGCLPASSSAPSDLNVWSLLTEAVPFFRAFCSPHAGSSLQRTHSLLHSITVPLESSVTFSPFVFLQPFAKYLWMAMHFLSKHLETSFEMRFLCMRELVKITEKNPNKTNPKTLSATTLYSLFISY